MTTKYHTDGSIKNTKMSCPSLWDISEFDWAYLAGLFDGEGCLKISGSPKRPLGSRWGLLIDICNTHRGIIEWLQSTFGGYIYSTERKPPQRRKFNWALGSTNDMRLLLAGMLPFLKIKKEQANIALLFLEHRCNRHETRGIKKSAEDINIQNSCVEKLRASRHKEWPPVPLRDFGEARCDCGKIFHKNSLLHRSCSTRCNSRIHSRKHRTEQRTSKVQEVRS